MSYAVVPPSPELWVDPETLLLLRQQTNDWRHKCINKYRRLPVHEGDTVLDVGAMIGGFTRDALARKAGRVIAVEPEPLNFELLYAQAGWQGWHVPTGALFSDPIQSLLHPWAHLVKQRVGLWERAVVWDPELREHPHKPKLYELYRSTGRTRSAHSLTPHDKTVNKRDRVAIHAVDFQWLLDLYKPNVIKFNAEGAEHDCFRPELVIPRSVHSVAVVLYRYHQVWRENCSRIIAQMTARGFQLDRTPRFRGEWAETVVWTRVTKEKQA